MYLSYEVVELDGEDSYLTRDRLTEWFIANNKQGFTALNKLERYRVTTEKTGDGLTYTIQFVYGDSRYTYKVDAVNKAITFFECIAEQDAVKEDIRISFTIFTTSTTTFSKNSTNFGTNGTKIRTASNTEGIASNLTDTATFTNAIHSLRPTTVRTSVGNTQDLHISLGRACVRQTGRRL